MAPRNFCFHFIFSLVSLWTTTSALDYYPKGYFDPSDVTTVTWAHAVNSAADLNAAISDAKIQMLEADLVVGTLIGSNDTKPIAIMAHPPANTSDLSFERFLNATMEHNKNLTVNARKGIKLDFKDFEAAKLALPVIQKIREDNPEQVNFPIWVNADILQGPINASASKVDGKALMDLQQELSRESTLSIGWTTRFGLQSNGELLLEGNYTRDQVEEMATLIKTQFPNPDNTTFVEITFPLRAALALNSLDSIKYLLDESGINFSSPSVTLWESAGDGRVDRTRLDNFIKEINASRVFVDLPYSLQDSSSGATASGKRGAFSALLVGLTGACIYFSSKQ